MKLAANVRLHLRRFDAKGAIENVPMELKHFLEKTDATNS